jgi:DNA-binding winged helix-turn-helix (wHTH) protein/Tol biopolymer transport system component
MSQVVQRPRALQIFQFAEFEADLRTREVRKNGDKVRLQDQPFSVLSVLLEHAGEVVTREQLRQHLWSSDTFVDFDNSLNTAINKIREALGDCAENPRFVETLPRRGYRFVGVVERPLSDASATNEASAVNRIAVAETDQGGGHSAGVVAAGRQRLQIMGESRMVIEETLIGAPEVGADVAPSAGHPQRSGLQHAVPRILACSLLLGVMVTAISYWHLAKTPVRTIVSEIPPPERTRFRFYGPAGSAPRISPDGHAVAFTATDTSGKTMLWVRSLESPAPRPLADTEGAADPFWSADSRSLGFFTGERLKTVDASGGPVVDVVEAPKEGGGSWNPDGIILFVPDLTKGIYQVSSPGGTPASVIEFDPAKFSYYLRPRFLPDGRHFLYMAESPNDALSGVYFASLDGKERRQVMAAHSGASYASGFLLYIRDNSLLAQAFDPERGQLKGDSYLVAQDVATFIATGLFDVSENGTLIYRTGFGKAEKQLTWFDRSGQNVGVLGDVADYYDVRLSPDGERLVFNAGYPTGAVNSEVWVDDLKRGMRMRLTIDPDTDHSVPVWSPDGTAILFGAVNGKAPRGIYRKPSNGAGSEELLLASEEPETRIWPTSLSHDGRFLLYTYFRGSMSLEETGVRVLPLAVDRKPHLFMQASASAYDGQFSPNARWVAYTSRESGREEVYVVPFDSARVMNTGPGPPDASSGSGKWQISTSGGRCPRWRGDGKELFYLSADNQMLAAGIEERGNGIEVRNQQALFRVPSPVMVFPGATVYDVTRDGKKFLAVTFSQQTPLTLAVNWEAELKK